MSLNYSFDNIKGFETNFPECMGEDGKQKMHSTVQAILSYGLLIGMGEITEKNVLEWYFRMRMYDALFGPISINYTFRKNQISLEETKKLIGLISNISEEPRSVFIKGITRKFFDQIQTEVWEAEDQAKVE